MSTEIDRLWKRYHALRDLLPSAWIWTHAARGLLSPPSCRPSSRGPSRVWLLDIASLALSTVWKSFWMDDLPPVAGPGSLSACTCCREGQTEQVRLTWKSGLQRAERSFKIPKSTHSTPRVSYKHWYFGVTSRVPAMEITKVCKCYPNRTCFMVLSL